MASCLFKAMSRGLSSSATCYAPINQVTVIGGGLMGSGIAQVTAQAGQTVVLVDQNDELLNKSKDAIEKSLQRVAKAQLKKRGEDPSKNEGFVNDFVGNVSRNITYSVGVAESVKTADLVIEAIVENLEVKQNLFQQLDNWTPEHTILATNTSSLSVTEIGDKIKRKDKYGGLHFFNPVPMMKLLEVVKTDELSDESYSTMMSWGQAVGKTCITCKDTPGFVVNRLLIPFKLEAFRLLERGVATVQDIDIAMKLGAGHPMGPFELSDYTGLDLSKFILDGWHKKYPDVELFKPVKIIDKLVSEGKFGRKTGQGFYSYKK